MKQYYDKKIDQGFDDLIDWYIDVVDGFMSQIYKSLEFLAVFFDSEFIDHLRYQFGTYNNKRILKNCVHYNLELKTKHKVIELESFAQVGNFNIVEIYHTGWDQEKLKKHLFNSIIGRENDLDEGFETKSIGTHHLRVIFPC